MMALEILSRSFRSIEVPIHAPRRSVRAGIYLLVDLGEIVYVGSSRDVDARLYQHAVEQRSVGAKSFDSALWIDLPVSVHPHYEGAFIRALCPRDSHRSPKHLGHDAEILDGFDLSHLASNRWEERETHVAPAAAADSAAGRVREARKLAGMSQAELARRIGIHRSSVRHWESGRSGPSDENLKQAAEALGVTAVSLWGGAA